MYVNTWLTETVQFDHMMIRLFSLLRDFIRFAGCELSLAATQMSPVSDGDFDKCLFEDVSKTCRLSRLPRFPVEGEVTEGESHRLETLATAISDLTASLVSLQKLARSTDFAASPTIASQVYHEVAADQNMIRVKLTDAAMSDFLFERDAHTANLDDELFEAAPDVGPGRLVPQLVAAKVTGRLEEVSSFTGQARFYRGG
ncbi:MAG: hypothetical protein CMK09_14920 [Ponticaulis sp.]|nr:hypothetical protein [Ponticaulis sp.]|tara:strand:+ start:8533 stop:9132 length:600 start_codon:yes stop_codon:yes gene_type:complete